MQCDNQHVCLIDACMEFQFEDDHPCLLAVLQEVVPGMFDEGYFDAPACLLACLLVWAYSLVSARTSLQHRLCCSSKEG